VKQGEVTSQQYNPRLFKIRKKKERKNVTLAMVCDPEAITHLSGGEAHTLHRIPGLEKNKEGVAREGVEKFDCSGKKKCIPSLGISNL